MGLDRRIADHVGIVDQLTIEFPVGPDTQLIGSGEFVAHGLQGAVAFRVERRHGGASGQGCDTTGRQQNSGSIHRIHRLSRVGSWGWLSWLRIVFR